MHCKCCLIVLYSLVCLGEILSYDSDRDVERPFWELEKLSDDFLGFRIFELTFLG